jgi:hypothetical protein
MQLAVGEALRVEYTGGGAQRVLAHKLRGAFDGGLLGLEGNQSSVLDGVTEGPANGVRSHKRKLLKAAVEPAGQTMRPCQEGRRVNATRGAPI